MKPAAIFVSDVFIFDWPANDVMPVRAPLTLHLDCLDGTQRLIQCNDPWPPSYHWTATRECFRWTGRRSEAGHYLFEEITFERTAE